MTIKEFVKKSYNNIFYTFVSIILLCAVFLSMVALVYHKEEEECYDDLHVQTKQIKDDIKRRIDSDRETLFLLANHASKLYSENRNFGLVFDSYTPTGLVKNVGILKPDNSFTTKKGILNFNGQLSFFDEAKKGRYITGRVSDVTNSSIDIIRIAEPIVVNGETVGILYGSIDLSELSLKYVQTVNELDAQLYVYESEKGHLIIDTFNDKLGNISSLSDRKYKKGYSYKQLIEEEKGYSVFESKVLNEDMYIHFSPLGINDWKIMLVRSESQVFKQANEIAGVLIISFALISAILIAYFVFLMRNERRKKNAITEASQIRKLLLEVNQQDNNIREALERITDYSKSRSTAFFDTDEEDYNYVSPLYTENRLTGEDKKYFISEILGYAASLRAASGKSVNIVTINAGSTLEKNNPKFNSFLKERMLDEVVFVAVADKNNRISVLSSINPIKVEEAKTILVEIAVCFSIAVFNKKHLHKTEKAATTDSLTGLLNRVTYKKDIKIFDEEKPENFSCVYIDVNELHLCNNRYGHAAGDEMLIYIANTLKEVFYGNYIYRMGGDEFLVFMKDTDQETVKEMIDIMAKRLQPMGYHVAMGMSYRTQNFNTEEVVNDAEIRMYEAKARYYQSKENKSVATVKETEYKIIKTGIGEIDTLLNVMKQRYNGIYKVSLNTDKAQRILMPAYLGYNETEDSFKKLFVKYVEDIVNPDFARAMFSFLNYDAIKRELIDGNIPRITYKKNNSETVTLSVYGFPRKNDTDPDDTLWVFEKI